MNMFELVEVVISLICLKFESLVNNFITNLDSLRKVKISLIMFSGRTETRC